MFLYIYKLTLIMDWLDVSLTSTSLQYSVDFEYLGSARQILAKNEF